MFILNKGQLNAREQSYKWYKSLNKPIFSITGPPGSGKTTLIDSLLDLIGLDKQTEVLYVTFVGRATLPLIINGLQAKTIHSTIYRIEEDYVYDKNGEPIRTRNNRYLKKPVFIKRKSLPKAIKLIVLDEAGMVPDAIIKDLVSFNIPIIALGDEDQLPPVFGKSSVLSNPDVILDEIMRQKQGDPILYLSQLAKRGIDIPIGQYGKRCFVVEKDILKYDWVFKKFNMIICGKNKTKEKINDLIRNKIRKVEDVLPVKYDKLICRKNNWFEYLDIGDTMIPLVNGLIGKVLEIYPETFNGRSMCIDFQPDFLYDYDYFEHIELDTKYLNLPYEYKINYKYGDGNIFDFGYASTVHLVQGSQFESIMYIQENMGNGSFQRKLDYTAITRAKKTLVIVKDDKPKKFFW